MSVLLDKSAEAAAAARLLLANEHYESACGRAYFAMFNAARVLLAELKDHDLESIRSHKAVLTLFSKHFVMTRRFDSGLARQFREAAEARAIADYDQRHVDEVMARETVQAMEKFLARASELLNAGKYP